MRLVWYASYGSNLSSSRFHCYIVGCKPPGSARKNPGCRDKTPPSCVRPVTLKRELFFAGYSSAWNGSAAFLKPDTSDAQTLGRMYLITEEQFNDVVLQENGMKVGTERLIPSYDEIARYQELRLPLKLYNLLLNVGDEDGHPILTFTIDPKDVPPEGPPSKPYLSIITAGLKETYPAMTKQEIVGYLSQASGIKQKIQPNILEQWIFEAFEQAPPGDGK